MIRSRTAALEHTRQITVFAMLGTLMFISKIVMEWLPNVHLLAMLTVVYTIVYRKKALIPIYIYVFLNGLYAGFSLWWVPYLYIWTVLWGVTMLLPRHMKPAVAVPVYMAVCGLHGLAFGTLYAPFQAIAFGLSLKATLAWISAGLPFDIIHACGNIVASVLVLPLSTVLMKLEKTTSGRAKAREKKDGSIVETSQNGTDKN